jgi:peptidoglycan biosynthesis protein MviN/MurJ (putative lipid II flippase)
MNSFPPPGDKKALEEGLVFTPKFDADGLLLANLAMAIALWLVGGPLDAWLEASWRARSLRLLGCIGLGLVVYLGALLALGMRLGQLRSRPGAPPPRHSV